MKHRPKKKLAVNLDNLVPPPGGTGVQPAQTPLEPDKVWLTLERKYRVAEYESMTVNLGAATSVDLGEDLSAASKRLSKTLREEFWDVVGVMREAEGL